MEEEPMPQEEYADSDGDGVIDAKDKCGYLRVIRWMLMAAPCSSIRTKDGERIRRMLAQIRQPVRKWMRTTTLTEAVPSTCSEFRQ